MTSGDSVPHQPGERRGKTSPAQGTVTQHRGFYHCSDLSGFLSKYFIVWKRGYYNLNGNQICLCAPLLISSPIFALDGCAEPLATALTGQAAHMRCVYNCPHVELLWASIRLPPATARASIWVIVGMIVKWLQWNYHVMLCAMDNDGKVQWMSWSVWIWFCDTCNLFLDDEWMIW